MARKDPFDAAVERAVKMDPRYPASAYQLASVDLHYTMRRLQEERVAKRLPEASSQHITGKQFALGLRDYMLEEYGPFAAKLLQDENIRATDDLGNIVYNLIAVGAFGKTPGDRKDDFHDVFDFYDAFVAPYRPLPDGEEDA